mgnify:FL=1
MPRQAPTDPALAALDRVLAIGWHSDALALDTATQDLILQGRDETEARAAVEAAFAKHFQIMGAV